MGGEEGSGEIDGHKVDIRASERASEGETEGGRGGGQTHHFICLSICTLVPKSQEENALVFRSACSMEGAADVI